MEEISRWLRIPSSSLDLIVSEHQSEEGGVFWVAASVFARQCVERVGGVTSVSMEYCVSWYAAQFDSGCKIEFPFLLPLSLRISYDREDESTESFPPSQSSGTGSLRSSRISEMSPSRLRTSLNRQHDVEQCARKQKNKIDRRVALEHGNSRSTLSLVQLF